MPLLLRLLLQKPFFAVASIICILVFWQAHKDGGPRVSKTRASYHATYNMIGDCDTSSSAILPCRNLPGAEDVLVVLKTGATEFEDKLPIHLNTTLRCYPNYLIFSDLAETFEGFEILDALESVSDEFKAYNPDFWLYRRLEAAGGRAAVRPHERSGPVSRNPGPSGKQDNPGWILDKWKFLPMVNRTLHECPGMKWYVFVETDTYIFWQTLLNHLEAMDWNKPYYIGAPTWIDGVEFAHGGAGFAVSRPALERVVNEFTTNQEFWEGFTAHHWAGDCVLGKAFLEAGIPLTRASPLWQNGEVGFMDYTADSGSDRLWCQPTISYHHLSPAVIEDMWLFEQEWIDRTREASKYLRHRDVYRAYILPRVRSSRQDWNNGANLDQGPVRSLDECREICKSFKTCRQYSLSPELRCLTTSTPTLGEWSRGFDSGWLYERMKSFYDEQQTCDGEGWIK